MNWVFWRSGHHWLINELVQIQWESSDWIQSSSSPGNLVIYWNLRRLSKSLRILYLLPGSLSLSSDSPALLLTPMGGDLLIWQPLCTFNVSTCWQILTAWDQFLGNKKGTKTSKFGLEASLLFPLKMSTWIWWKLILREPLKWGLAVGS